MDELQSPQSSRLESIPVEISVKICRPSLELNQMLEWAPGTVLSFEQSAASPLEICIDGRAIGCGQAIQIGSRLGLKLQQVEH